MTTILYITIFTLIIKMAIYTNEFLYREIITISLLKHQGKRLYY